ncbi:MAG TPA: two-component regulator propeller domain-containing protein [Rudaea sp.]|nr:two-component regulator propeller domain-containing protein [Rudaea sp.]
MPTRGPSSWWRGKGALLALSLLALAGVRAEEPSPETARFRSLTDADGLSQVSALALAQDRQGFLWIGTQVGLNRYDGASFRTFIRQRRQADSLSEHYISALLPDPDGGLWIGTLNGLNRFDPAKEKFTAFLPRSGDAHALPHQKINALLRDREGGLWIGSDGGLSLYRPGSHDFANFADGLEDRRVEALVADGAGGLFVGTAAGLMRFDPATGRFARVPGNALRGWIDALLLDRAGELWIGTKDAGLLRYSPASGAVVQWRHVDGDPQSLSHDRLYALLEDRAGRLWIGTEAGADVMLDRYERSPHFVRFQHRPQLPSSIGAGRVVSLMQDASGDLWFGTWSGGASLLSPVRSRFLSFDADALDTHAADSAEITTMVSAGPDHIWLGTRRGLFDFDDKSYRLRPMPATAGMLIYALAVDGDELLLGSDQGIFRYDPRSGNLRSADVPAAVGHPFIYFIVVEDDRVWVNTRDGDLFVLDRPMRKVLAHHTLESRAHFMADFDAQTKIFGNDNGLYWFSADGLEPEGRLEANPDDPHGLQSDTCHYFLRGSDGQLWLATAAGLHRLELPAPRDFAHARFTVFTRGGGANTNAIKSMIEDRHGRLWMSSNAGIARFDPKTAQFTSYGAADGAIDRGYYAFVHTVTADGHFAFGGASGFTIFDPEAIAELPPPPRPLLTGLELDDRLVEPSDGTDAVLDEPLYRTAHLVLPAGRARGIGFEFSSPYFVAPEQLRFAYKLDGFNADWIETDAKRRIATYTNLAPGDYVFRVRVRTADAGWNGEQATLALGVEPFWWQTLWAKLAGACALAAAAWAIFYLRLRGHEQQRRLLADQVEERTADILKLGQVGQELTATLNFEQAAERVYRQVRARLDAHVFLIGIYRADRGVVELEYLIEDDQRRARIDYAIDDPTRAAAWCVRECRELVIQTREQMRQYIAEPAGPKQGEMMESVVYLPLRIEQRVIGCLSVQSPRPRAYGPAHLEFLRALASYTAIALDNADNYRRLDQAMAQTREAMANMHRAHHALEDAYARIEELSRTDALTGLGNRRSLDQRLPALIAAVDHGDEILPGKTRLAFFVLDVDRFKTINDEYGHATGDLVLGALGDLLHRHFGDPAFAVRWGGEEFLAVLPVADADEALGAGERLRAAIAMHRVDVGAAARLQCTVSIGFACYPFDASAPRRMNWEQIVEIADGALYVAKRNGRNRVFGYRCTGPVDADFEARLRRGAEELGKCRLVELLGAGIADGTALAS